MNYCIFIFFLLAPFFFVYAKVKSVPITGTMRCQNKIEVMIQKTGSKKKTFYKKDFVIPLKDIEIMTLKDQRKIVGYIYPQWGIDYKMKDKKILVYSDKKSSLKVSKNTIAVLSCEVRDE